MQRAVDAAARFGPVRVDQMRGCTSEEILEIAELWGKKKLPKAYEEFLVLMGRGLGDLFVGSRMFYPDILNLPKEVAWLIAGDPNFALPANASPFASHQGYQFLYMTDGDDPPVYFYMEMQGKGVFRRDRFSQFVADGILAELC